MICTDKTGTLTQSEMTVREVWVGSQPFRVEGVGYAPEGAIVGLQGAITQGQVAQDWLDCLRAAALCNNARWLPPGEGSPHWSILGDPTEAALLVVARKARIDPEVA